MPPKKKPFLKSDAFLYWAAAVCGAAYVVGQVVDHPTVQAVCGGILAAGTILGIQATATRAHKD